MNEENNIRAAFETVTLPEADLGDGVMARLHTPTARGRHKGVRFTALTASLAVLSVLLVGAAIAAVQRGVIFFGSVPEAAGGGTFVQSYLDAVELPGDFMETLSTAGRVDTTEGEYEGRATTTRTYRREFPTLGEAMRLFGKSGVSPYMDGVFFGRTVTRTADGELIEEKLFDAPYETTVSVWERDDVLSMAMLTGTFITDDASFSYTIQMCLSPDWEDSPFSFGVGGLYLDDENVQLTTYVSPENGLAAEMVTRPGQFFPCQMYFVYDNARYIIIGNGSSTYDTPEADPLAVMQEIVDSFAPIGA
ncbi:MAG: hypothetical protein LBT60_06035 [Oscillospiraceae bacterium]|jgi:hypothetical protein|nr:hypothetical protein [Oscillospiraceae bacterium]